MHVFYYPEKITLSEKIVLSREESQHCIKVLRHREGDEVFVVNGLGERFQARIGKADPQACELEALQKEKVERDYKIHIAIAPTKQPERIEWFVEKACELGIDDITFLECEHSVRTRIKLERIEKITISALKQSKNFTKARIHPPIRFKEFVQLMPAGGTAFIAVANQVADNYLLKKTHKHQSYLLLIGPEGDFSKEEVDMAMAQQVIPVSLGDSILRTETAGIIGCHLLHVANSDFAEK